MFIFVGNKFFNCPDKTLVSVIVIDPDLKYFYILKYCTAFFPGTGSDLFCNKT